MQYVTENITPAKALEYINTNKDNNRPISKSVVHSYADTMKKGKWLLNGECIIFDNEGRLQNGFHRMHGVIEAGIPVRFDVCRGVDAEAFTTYDCGRHRTVGQLLAMQNVKHYNLVGAIITANERLIKSGRLYENNANSNGNGIKRTNTDNYESYRKDPDGFNETASEIVRLRNQCRAQIPGSWSGGFLYFMTHTGGYTKQEVLPFIEALYSLDTAPIAVCNMLRKTIQDVAMSGKKLGAETLWVFIVKAWNHYIKGTTPKFLRYQKENENIPKLILK